MMFGDIKNGQFRQVFTIRVRYSETDKMGIVYNGNYFTWFEIARTEYCRSFGQTYRDWEERGYFLPVVESHCQYKHPASYDDTVDLYCRAPASQIKPHSIVFEYRLLLSPGTVMAEGWTKHAFVNREGKVCRKNNEFYEWLLGEVAKLNAG